MVATTPATFIDGYRLIDGNELNDKFGNPQWSLEAGVSATPGGSVNNSHLIVETITQVTSASVPGAAVTLPQALPGRVLMVINESPNPITVYAAGGSTIDGAPGNIGITQQPNVACYYTAVQVKQWYRMDFLPIGFPYQFLESRLDIAQLRLWSSLPGSSPAIMALVYNTVPGDGGGFFYLDAADHTTPDNGTTVIVDSVGNRWKRELVQGVYIANVPYGIVTSTNVQGAIDQLAGYTGSFTGVATVNADLRGVNPADFNAVFVEGYYANGDGGGGYFYSVTGAAPGTYVDNGGTIIVPTGGNGSSAWLRPYTGIANVREFGAKGDNLQDDTAYCQKALDTGAGSVYFPEGTYLIGAIAGVGLLISNSVTIYGDGESSVVKSIPTLEMDGKYYSNNLFTTAASLDNLTFTNLYLDGAGTGIGQQGFLREYALILTFNVQKLEFSNLTVTNYSADWSGTPEYLYDRHFQAVTVRNNVEVEYTKCLGISLRDNNFEQFDIYNPEGSNAFTIIQNCTEINSGAIPYSHTAFQVIGGHVEVADCYFKNTKFSTLNLNNNHSANVSQCVFIDQYQIGFAASVNFGQSLWATNNNARVSNCYFENVDGNAISFAGGNNLTIEGNTFINGGNNPIKVVANMDTTSYSDTFGDYWPTVPSLTDYFGVSITNNYVKGALLTTGPTGRAIWLSYVDLAAGKFWRSVNISNNTVLSNTAPHDVKTALVIDQVFDVSISNNYFNYSNNAFYSYASLQQIIIDSNYFNSDYTTSGTDIAFTGAYASNFLVIQNNIFKNIPRGAAYNIAVVAGRTFDSIFILNNKNTKPSYLIDTTSAYYASNTLGGMVTGVPTTGIYRQFDRVATVPAAGVPPEYVCAGSGCFATFTATADGISGNYYITVTDPTQFLPGMYISIANMNTGGATPIFRYVTDVAGNDVHLNNPVLFTNSGQAVTAINPTFVQTANYT